MTDILRSPTVASHPTTSIYLPTNTNRPRRRKRLIKLFSWYRWFDSWVFQVTKKNASHSSRESWQVRTPGDHGRHSGEQGIEGYTWRLTLGFILRQWFLASRRLQKNLAAKICGIYVYWSRRKIHPCSTQIWAVVVVSSAIYTGYLCQIQTIMSTSGGTIDNLLINSLVNCSFLD